jgi:ubiquinone/menaquinone biosynthesis C-methylase UbiE
MAFLTPAHLVERLYIKKGSAVELARAVTDTGKVYAIDIHRDILQTLEHTAHKMGLMNIETVWADLETTTYIDAYSMEAVILSNILFTLERPEKAIEEAARILVPAGRILCVDWSGPHDGIGPHPSHVVTEAKAEDLFTKHGFQIGERLPAGDYHYAFIATKL